MPLISTFYGVQIYIYYREHGRPHYHAFYQGFEATFDIQTGQILLGTFPPKVASILEDWTRLRHNELMLAWRLARFGEPLPKIPGADQ